MWTWRTRTRTSTKPRTLALESLESREVPAVAIQLDYSFDTSGFFNDPTRRAVLQQVADDVGSRLSAPLAAIVPGGGNTWTASFINPTTGQQAAVNNPVIPANTIVVYVGARPLDGSQAGQGGNGGYGGTGFGNWLDTLRTRGAAGFSLWGGSIAFDSVGTNWHFGSGDPARGTVDFYSVAVHELGHVLGLGTARQWFSLSNGGAFLGPNAQAVYGGPVPLSPDGSHWADGVEVDGHATSLDPFLQEGPRVPFSALEFAALADIGWSLDFGGSPVSPPAAPLPTNPAPVEPEPTSPAAPSADGLTGRVVLTGAADGSARGFSLSADGQLVGAGSKFQPFPGFTGAVRGAVADFNGDGVPDGAFGTGAGIDARVRVIDGVTGGDLLGATQVLDGFGGGVYLAAGDIDRDGKAELAVSADAGGGTRVTVYALAGGLTRVADFLAFGDPAFRGGSRVAMGDVNRDGSADLIVGAGIGGGPRVSVYDGASLAAGSPVSLVPDFFALDPGLRSGVFVTSADLDGDGYSDVLYSTGDTGGPRVRVVGGAVLTANPGRDAYFLPALADFFALDPADRSGLRIAAHDLNDDGKAELVVASGHRDTPQVRVLTLADMQSPTGPTSPYLNPMPGPTTDGLYVG